MMRFDLKFDRPAGEGGRPFVHLKMKRRDDVWIEVLALIATGARANMIASVLQNSSETTPYTVRVRLDDHEMELPFEVRAIPSAYVPYNVVLGLDFVSRGVLTVGRDSGSFELMERAEA